VEGKTHDRRNKVGDKMSGKDYVDADFFKKKNDFIDSEIERLRAAINPNLSLVRIGVDWQVQLGPFAEVRVTEPLPCIEPNAGLPAPEVVRALFARKRLTPLNLDCFLGAKVIDQRLRLFQLDPDSVRQEFLAARAARSTAKARAAAGAPDDAVAEGEAAAWRSAARDAAKARKVAPVRRTTKRRTATDGGVDMEADGGAQLRGFGQPGFPLEIPPFHPFLAKSEVQFRDNGKVLDTSEGCIAIDCPNTWKSVKAYDEMPLPLLWRAKGTTDTPYPDAFRYADLPEAGPDQLKCLCQEIAMLIKEVKFEIPQVINGPQVVWSNFVMDLEGIPDVTTLHAIDVITTQLYARVDCLTQVFCPCPGPTPFGVECPPDEHAPFEVISGAFETDGGVPLTSGEESALRAIGRGVDRATSDRERPAREAPFVNHHGRSQDVLGLMSKANRARLQRKK
jgi:hypothetical protein